MTMFRLKAISLLQPWASLLAFGDKCIETRSWRAPRNVIWQRVAIHASASFPASLRCGAIADPDMRPRLEAGCRRHYGRPLLDPEELHRYLKHPRKPVPAVDLPTGAIIAVGMIRTSLPTEEWIGLGISAVEQAFGDFSAGRHGWLFSDVIVLPEPVPCKGALGIWAVTPSDAAIVEAEVAQVVRPVVARPTPPVPASERSE